jgi:carboxypeptidase PM20D1
MPARLGEADLKRIHGIDERIAIKDYLDLVRYYIRLIRNGTS